MYIDVCMYVYVYVCVCACVCTCMRHMYMYVYGASNIVQIMLISFNSFSFLFKYELLT